MAIRRKKRAAGAGQGTSRQQVYEQFEKIAGSGSNAFASVVAQAGIDVQSAMEQARAAIAEAERTMDPSGIGLQKELAASQAAMKESTDAAASAAKRAEAAAESAVQSVLRSVTELTSTGNAASQADEEEPEQ